MTKMTVTWLGEDDQYFEQMYDSDGNETGKRPAAGPSFMYWGDVRFDKDKPVLIDNETPGLTQDEKVVRDLIVAKTPKMIKRFKVEPVQERQERQSAKG